MQEEIDKLKQIGKTIFKGAKAILAPVLFPLLIIVIIGIFVIELFYHWMFREETSYKENNWSNVPFVGDQFISNIKIDEDGNITTEKTPQEVWDELIKNNNNVSQYLQGGGVKELTLLMNAELATMYPDTRSKKEIESKPIDWNASGIITGDVNSKNVQGIIKFKRADSNGNETLITYMKPDEFQELIDEYNETGSDDAKEEIMKHFTLKKSTAKSGSSGGTTAVGNLASLDGVLFVGDSYTQGISDYIDDNIIERGYVGASPSHWLSENAVSSDGWGHPIPGTQLPENDDSITAVCVLLGVNNPSQTEEMKKLIDKLAAKYSGKTVYVQRVFALPKDGNEIASNPNLNSQIKSYNEAIESYCSTLNMPNIKFIDTTADVLEVDSDGIPVGKSEYYESDGLHLNAKGIRIWVQNIKGTLMGNSSSSTSTSSTTPTSSSTTTTSSTSTSSSTTTSSSTKKTTSSSQESPFKKYPDLTEHQLKALAIVCQAEQGTPKGAAAEASLMANHMDLETGNASKYSDDGQGLYEYVKATKASMSWFNNAPNYMDSYVTPWGDALRDDVLNAVSAVLVEGKRTLPGYIDEHDSKGDIGSISTGSKNNDSDYIQNETIVYQNANISTRGHWTFYCFPDPGNSDPFGYTDQAKDRKDQIGDFCYDFDTGIGSGSAGTVPGLAGRSVSAYYALVPTLNESITIDESGNVENATSRITATNVDFQSMIRNYKMPFSYIWAMLMYSQDIDFALDLVDLVLDSELEITIHDNLTVTTTTDTKNYTVETITTTVNETGLPTSYEPVKYSYVTSRKTINRNNTLDAALTKAKVWYVDYTKEYTYSISEEEIISSSEIDLSTGWQNTGNSIYRQTGTETITTTRQTMKWIASLPDVKERTSLEDKEDNFIKIFLRNAKGQQSIISGFDWLIEALENNIYTSEYVDLTKYLINKAMNPDSDETFDFKAFVSRKFQSIASGVSGSGDIIRECEEVMNIFLERGGQYSVDGNILTYGDIDKVLNEDKYICCASYVSCVLYRAGIISAEDINKFNYHYTVTLPDMLRNAGFREVSMDEIQAGDVVNKPGSDDGHALIYAGGDNYYDQSTCVVSSKGVPPTGGVKSGFASKYTGPGWVAWRAPGK